MRCLLNNPGPTCLQYIGSGEPTQEYLKSTDWNLEKAVALELYKAAWD